MFERFAKSYSVSGRSQAASRPAVPTGTAELDDLLSRYAGSSFNSGLYRLHASSDIPKWNEIVSQGFLQVSGRITCFGYDWLGRQFALDTRRTVKGSPAVTMFEPGTGKALEIPGNLVDFHDAELIEFHDAALASSFFEKWRSAGNADPMPDQCVGYKRPLFLGGRDTLDNLELSDLEVYWGLMGQLISRVRGLPKGTSVRIR